MKWCRIIEVDEQQVLFYLERDTINDPTGETWCMHQVIMPKDEALVDFVIGGIKEPFSEPSVLDQLTEESAKDALAAISTLVMEMVKADEYD